MTVEQKAAAYADQMHERGTGGPLYNAYIAGASGAPISPYVAWCIMNARNAIVKDNDLEEVYHFLYKIASPNFDKDSHEVWKELENLANQYKPPTE